MDLRSSLLTLALSSLLPAALLADVPSLPLTSEKMDAYLLDAKTNVVRAEEEIISVLPYEKTFENTMRPWNRLGNDILLNFSVLTYLAQNNFPVAQQSYRSIQELQGFLYYSIILNPALQNAMLCYAENALSSSCAPTPYESYMVSRVLDSFAMIKPSLPPEKQTYLDNLQSLYASIDKAPFHYLKGLAPEKSLPAEDAQHQFTVLNLNTCFLPGELVFVHGGVAPWQDRVMSLADKIRSTAVDVVCLQEVFTEDACHALYEALKEDYSHFYVAIGPRPLGFSPETFGLPSGLFVASKFPVETPRFTPFAVTGYQMNYGFFDFTIQNGDAPLGHIFATHLQSLNEEQFPQIRAQELMQIVERIQTDYRADLDTSLPRFICGDFNIAWGSGEPGEKLIRAYFYDDYNSNRAEVEDGDRTCTDYFSDRYFAAIGYPQPIGANIQIIDYALLFQPLPQYSDGPACVDCAVETVLVPMNALNSPETAISDHHGLLTTIKRDAETKKLIPEKQR